MTRVLNIPSPARQSALPWKLVISDPGIREIFNKNCTRSTFLCRTKWPLVVLISIYGYIWLLFKAASWLVSTEARSLGIVERSHGYNEYSANEQQRNSMGITLWQSSVIRDVRHENSRRAWALTSQSTLTGTMGLAVAKLLCSWAPYCLLEWVCNNILKQRNLRSIPMSMRNIFSTRN